MQEEDWINNHPLRMFADRFKITGKLAGKKSSWKVCWAAGLICCALTGHAKQIPPDSAHYINQLNHRAILSQQKRLDTAFVYAMQALNTATRQDYTKGKADAWYALGSYYGLRNNHYLSIRYYMDALRAYEKLHDNSSIGLLYTGISKYYEQSGQRQQALYYTRKAMDTGASLRNDPIYGLILTHYADVHMADAAKRDSVQWALLTARNIFRQRPDTAAILQLDLLDIRQLLHKKDTVAAEQQLLSLISRATLNGYHYAAMNASLLMAGTRAANHQADSIQYLAQMVTLSLAGGYRELMLPYAIQLYDWYSRQGKPDTAAYYSGILLDILERRAAVKSTGEMDYIAYYTQQHELHSLQLSRAIQQKKLDKQRLENNTRLYLIGFLLLLLVLASLAGSYFFRAYRKTKRSAVLLAAKNQEVNKKNQLLQEQDDFKGKLVSIVAHDFRSPLSNIINIAAYLKEEVLTTSEANDWMAQVERTAHYSLQSFDNILAWIRSQSSGFIYIPKPCHIASMIPEVLRYLENMVSSKQLEVIAHIDSNLTVWADREMLQFVHRNIIHNAIKFSPLKGSLSITVHIREGLMTLSVDDEGPGIPEEILPYLFEYSNRKENTSGQHGAGLALIICRDFIQKMNGEITAINRPGGGARVSYRLSLANPPQLS